jgi:hypothetical protein
LSCHFNFLACTTITTITINTIASTATLTLPPPTCLFVSPLKTSLRLGDSSDETADMLRSMRE